MEKTKKQTKTKVTKPKAIEETKIPKSLDELLLEIQGMNLVVIANRTGKNEKSDTEYQWADIERIMEVLRPVLNEKGILLYSGLKGDNVIVEARYKTDLLTSSFAVGPVSNNNEFSARVTTIRRDSIILMFNLVIKDMPKLSDAAIEPAEIVEKTASLDDFAAPIKVLKKPTKDDHYEQAVQTIQACGSNQGLQVIRANIMNSTKLDSDQVAQLVRMIDDLITNGPTVN